MPFIRWGVFFFVPTFSRRWLKSKIWGWGWSGWLGCWNICIGWHLTSRSHARAPVGPECQRHGRDREQWFRWGALLGPFTACRSGPLPNVKWAAHAFRTPVYFVLSSKGDAINFQMLNYIKHLKGTHNVTNQFNINSCCYFSVSYVESKIAVCK